MFGDSEYELNMQRQSHTRKPANLPHENDLLLLRNYTVSQITKITSKYINNKFISSSEYKILRSLAICRLTLFNVRRGGEPARFTLRQWEDAKSGACLGANVIQKTDF